MTYFADAGKHIHGNTCNSRAKRGMGPIVWRKAGPKTDKAYSAGVPL